MKILTSTNDYLPRYLTESEVQDLIDQIKSLSKPLPVGGKYRYYLIFPDEVIGHKTMRTLKTDIESISITPRQWDETQISKCPDGVKIRFSF